MAKRQLQDADGNWIEVDDEVSLIGPAPKDQPKESTRDSRFQPIAYDHTGGPKPPTPKHDPHTLGPQPVPDDEKVQDAGNHILQSPEFLKLWQEKK